MKISFICSTAYIEKYQTQGDFVLALAHLIDKNKQNNYEKAILSTKLPIILDNSLFEKHEPEGIDSLITKALKIKAESFFAPDYLFNRKETEKSFENTYYCMQKRQVTDTLKVNVVIQANNIKDYTESYKKFATDPRVNLIGLSILSIPESFKEETGTSDITTNRIECIKQLNKLKTHKNSHLLGLGNSIKDLIYAKETASWIVSNDSSSMFWNAIQGKKLLSDGRIEGGKTDKVVDFNFNSATKKQLDLVQENITLCKKLLKQTKHLKKN